VARKACVASLWALSASSRHGVATWTMLSGDVVLFELCRPLNAHCRAEQLLKHYAFLNVHLPDEVGILGDPRIDTVSCVRIYDVYEFVDCWLQFDLSTWEGALLPEGAVRFRPMPCYWNRWRTMFRKALTLVAVPFAHHKRVQNAWTS